uniref:uncharacterized protein LOC122603821 isoform X2 n=1 Tax=Erigeron canadensis TaxID=72917 RepID=UPI001CB89DBA|nr:uncharacterized protein LOC122603821 isoform X2 [Erigeron canadensis]
MSHKPKLIELLRNITSIDLQLCSESSKEFMKLLRSDDGGEMLRQYVETSPNCSELLQAWNFRQSKPGLSYIMSLINVVLSHKDGVYKVNDASRIVVSRALDKFARLLLEEKIGDVYNELNSKENKGKNGALLLMASIVGRGSGLAADVAKSFNFKLPSFLKCAEYDKRRKNVETVKRKVSTRRSFVRFAMSFLEIGDARLLRWVLQQKEMFSGVLRGLGSDEDEIVVYVLSTLRDKVLVPESLVPVGLRSVLFGSVTLEQLVEISGRDDGGDASEVAKKVLFMVCTDPANGLMPDSKALPFPLKGNLTRLLGVMKKLKATEVEFHKDLLLAIVRGKPSFGSAYLDEFPYNLEDHASWFAAVSLAANLISSVNAGLSFDYLDSQSGETPSINSSEVQSIIKCIGPRPFNRLVINKGLLHSESHIQHGTLRLVLEALKLLDSVFASVTQRSKSSKQTGCKWASLKQDIQDEVQLLLPDHQVLLSLISSLNNRYKSDERSLKRGADTTVLLENSASRKKLKIRNSNEETDILVGGISLCPDDGTIQEEGNLHVSDNLNDDLSLIKELWDTDESNNVNMVAGDEDIYFYSKLLEALEIYHHTMPSVLEGSFDFFKVLPSNALSLPTILQQSLLSLLVEHIGWSSKQDIPVRYPPLMYKHLLHFINLVVCSPVKVIRDEAYVLAQAAMLSTGAFDNNETEIGAWLLFLPGFNSNESGIETIQNLSSVVNSFFCDVVSTVGNNLFKYWDLLRLQINNFETTTKDNYPRFSPLFICALEKCLRLLGSESGSFNLPEKSMISIYVSNTLRYLLQTQVEAGLLSSLISLILSKKLEGIDGDLCEWGPLKSLLYFSRSIANNEGCILTSIDRKKGLNGDSLINLLDELTNLAESENNTEMTKAFSLSILCSSPDLILQHFPEVISVSQKLNGFPFSILLSICCLESSFLNDVCKSRPEFALSRLEQVDFSSMDSANSSEAFSYFIKQAPFYVLFPAIISSECSFVSEPSKLQDMLLAKLSKEMLANFVSSFRLLFFWFHQIQSSYRFEPAEKLIWISDICVALIKSMLADHSANQYAQEIAETIFCHPAVFGAVESPLSAHKELKVNILDHPADNFLCFAREGVHIMDQQVLQVLEIFCNQTFLVSFGYVNKRIATAFKSFLQKLVLMLKNRFDWFIKSIDLLSLIPTLYAFHSLIRFISPRELLELVSWMFSRISLDESAFQESKVSALSVGLNIAGCAFGLVPLCLEEVNVSLFERVYNNVIEIASRFELVVADLCLLQAVKIASKCNSQSQSPRSLPNHMVMSRVVSNTPMSLISKCFKKTSMINAQFLFHLTESSLLHLSFFGLPFMEMVNKSLTGKCDEAFLMLLPTALSFMNFISMRYGEKCCKHLRSIHSLYWEILFNGFSNWNSFSSRDIFEVKQGKSVPSTVEELCDLFNNNLLGTAVAVMQAHLVSSGPTVKRSKRLKLFDSIIPPGTENLFDCNALKVDRYSIDETLNLIMKLVTKVILCKMLLFSCLERSNKEHSRSVTLINSLVSTWRLIVKKFSLKLISPLGVKDTKSALVGILESFVLRNVAEVTMEMCKDSDIKVNSVISIEKLARSCLLHRFEDSATLGMLRIILTFEPEDKSLHVQILQLLLAHSQFASTIQPATKSSSSLQFGIIFRPMSSILRSLTFAPVDHESHTSELYTKQLEVVKLLSVLCHFGEQAGSVGIEKDLGIHVRELLFLLLSSYGATISEKDLEIYKIMQELQSIDKSNSGYIDEMDYLWGPAAIKVRKVRETEQAFSSDDKDGIENCRRNQFRENLPIDPRMCAATVLHFPFNRNVNSGDSSSNKLPDDNNGRESVAQRTSIETMQIYDPVFILRMSLHGLSMDYIEPVEFASLGMLAVAFVSLSSPDVEIRKLAYTVLTVFRDALVSQKRKEVNRLRPLLTYVQNGISEEWQWIPSVHALFAAEASVLILDPLNNHFKTITKLLLQSPMNTKMISFFDEFFWSNSVNFKSDRIWMLRLLYSGLNLEDDTQIYVRSSILEKLLSFYTSSLSDNESRDIILQIVNKCMKFETTSKYLIERCGVIPWLSSLISSFCGSKYQEQMGALLTHLPLVIKVANDIALSRNIMQCVARHSVEQLAQLSCHLYALFVDKFELVNEIHSADLILEIMFSTLKISQEREVNQPHFTFSIEGLYQLSQATDAELGLKVVLINTPQAALLSMDCEKLEKFVLWAVSIALRSEGSDAETNDSLLSKLLRWLTASVILAMPSWQLGKMDLKHNLENSFSETLQLFLGAEWSSRVVSGSEELLATTIYYLQQVVGKKCKVFTSVVSSLCLLLLPDLSHTDVMLDGGSTLTSLLSRIDIPTEVNHLWRWSFEKPWKDPSTNSCSVDGLQACQSILVMVSNVLGKKSSHSRILSVLDVENSGVFNWERSLLAETL